MLPFVRTVLKVLPEAQAYALTCHLLKMTRAGDDIFLVEGEEGLLVLSEITRVRQPHAKLTNPSANCLRVCRIACISGQALWRSSWTISAGVRGSL